MRRKCVEELGAQKCFAAVAITGYHQGPDFDDMSSFSPCEIDDAIQYINLGYAVQAPK